MHFIYTFYTLYTCTYILYIYTLDVHVDLICEPQVKFIKPSVCSKYIWLQVWAFFRTSAQIEKNITYSRRDGFYHIFHQVNLLMMTFS